MGKPESTDDACLKCCGVCVLTSILPHHGTRSVPRILRFHKEQLRGRIVLVDPDIPKPIARVEYSQSAKGAPFALRPSFAQDHSQMHHEQPAAQDHSQMHHEQPAKGNSRWPKGRSLPVTRTHSVSHESMPGMDRSGHEMKGFLGPYGMCRG